MVRFYGGKVVEVSRKSEEGKEKAKNLERGKKDNVGLMSPGHGGGPGTGFDNGFGPRRGRIVRATKFHAPFLEIRWSVAEKSIFFNRDVSSPLFPTQPPSAAPLPSPREAD